MRLANHLVYDLSDTAEHLLGVRSGRANLLKVFRRRAISSSYYAVFQAVCFVVADQTVGWGSPPTILDPLFRTPDHRQVKDRLSKSPNTTLRRLGLTVAELQDRRHDADYAPPAFNPPHVQALALFEQARDAIGLIENLTLEERRLLVVTLLARPR